MIFDRLTKRSDTSSDVMTPQQWLMGLLGGSETASGETITSESAVKATATVYTCVKILSNHIAMLPSQVFYIDKNNKRKRDKESAVSKLIEKRPNPYMTPFEFKQIMESHRQLYGNGYAEIEWGRDGYPKNLWPLNPKCTTVELDIKGKPWIVTTIPGNKYRKLPYASVIHLKGLTIDGLMGLNPIQVVREQIGVQNATQKYIGKFYSNGTMTRGILKVPQQLNKEAKTKVREEWEGFGKGLTNAHRVAILDAGLDYQSLGMNQSDAQFIETQKFTKSEIAQIFSVPLHMLAELDRATFSNIEQQSMEFLRDTLTPLIISWEQTLQYQLFSNADIDKGYYIKFNLNSILRGDSQARAAYYEKMVQLGVYSINEVRELEDTDAIDNGDGHRVDLNHISLDIADQYQLTKASGNNTSSGKGVT